MRKSNLLNQENLNNRATSELIGIAKGLIADGKLCEQEADFLCSWLSRNAEHYETFPFYILFDRIEAMLSDNIIDEEERRELFELLSELTGEKKAKEEFDVFSTTLPLTRPCPEIIFDNHTFCFTGTFVSRKRKDCEKAVFERGGITQNDITMDLNYLVIGSKPTKDWKYSSFGNKIIKATDYNTNKNTDIAIICETDWLNAVKNSPATVSADKITKQSKKKRTPVDPMKNMILE